MLSSGERLKSILVIAREFISGPYLHTISSLTSAAPTHWDSNTVCGALLNISFLHQQSISRMRMCYRARDHSTVTVPTPDCSPRLKASLPLLTHNTEQLAKLTMNLISSQLDTQNPYLLQIPDLLGSFQGDGLRAKVRCYSYLGTFFDS
jgi:hypothetical protein